MRLSYPRSFLSLLLIGFTIVAAPLLFALFTNAVAFERLAGLSEQAVQTAVKVTQASRALIGAVTALERSARQYAVAGEAPFLEAYGTHREGFRTLLAQLGDMGLSAEQRAELDAIEKHEAMIHGLLAGSRPTADLSTRLALEFAALSERSRALVRIGDEVIDEGIERLRTQAVRSRNNVFWLVVSLIPTAVLLIAAFTFLIARPINQVRRSIRGLGEGRFGEAIRIEGPGDIVRLGEQLDWLRERLVALEAQKTRFLQHMSHELKTPLTALREGSDLLSSGVVGNLNAEQREIARILQENSIELRRLIEGLLSYSAVHERTSRLAPTRVALREVVRRVLDDRKLAIVAKDLRIALECENVTAWCDEEKIRVVLDNLLSNAVKYSPEHGRICIGLRSRHGEVVIEVADEGPGIPEHERDRVFEAFYRGAEAPSASIKGTGLGLSIVKEYVELHGGEVGIVPGRGAHFVVRLPRGRESQAKAA